MLKTQAVLFTLPLVLLVLLWLKQRRSSKKSAASSPKTPSYEPLAPPLPDAAADLLATCRRLEAALRAAEEAQDQAKALQLRRVLRRLYAALECLTGHEAPESSEQRPSTRSRAARRTKDLSQADRVASTATLTASEPASHQPHHHRSNHHDDVASVASDMFYDVDDAEAEAAEDEDAENASSPDEAANNNTVLMSRHLSISAAVPAAGAVSVYEEARRMAVRGEITCRKNRTDETGCANTVDFLARLHCIRQATTIMLQDPARRRWLAGTGRDMLGAILTRANANVAGFHAAWDELTEFLEAQALEGSGKIVAEELAARGCLHITLYDAVVDFVLLDAFDDMKRLPPSVASVLANTWIPRTVKERTLAAAIWSVIRTRKGMAAPTGLMVRFYGVMEHVSPVLACGLLGCHNVESLERTIGAFKDLICAKTVVLFHFDRDECTTMPQLVEHVTKIITDCSQEAQQVLAQ